MKRKLSVFDAGWLMMETRKAPMHIGALCLFAVPEGAPPDYMEKLYQHMLNVPGACRPYNQKVDSRFPGGIDAKWVEDRNFDAEYHVRHSALPRPGRVRELLALVSRLHAQRLDPARPLWETYFIEGLEGDRFAMYIKMHHSMIDGVAGMSLIQERMATSPDEILPPPWSSEWEGRVPKKKRPPAPTPTVRERLNHVRRGVSEVVDLTLHPSEAQGTRMYRAPRSIFNRRVTASRRFAAQSWPLERIKAAAKRHNGTVNDIFLAMCAGAVREYLLSQDALPSESLVAQVPVALRTVDEASEGGNAITTLSVNLGTSLADPVERLRAIQASMQAGKDRLSAMKKEEINVFTMLTSVPLSLGQVSGMAGRGYPMFNLLISNVPGPRKPLYAYGAKMLAYYPVSLVLHGYALNITVFSYCDNLEFGIIACRNSLPSIQRMLDYIENALAELEQGTSKPHSTAEGRRTSWEA